MRAFERLSLYHSKIIDIITFDHMNKAYTEVAASLKNKSILTKKELTFTCEGTSMDPVLQNGDEISVSRVPLADLRFGDIVTYENNSVFITHRFFYRKRQKNGDLLLILKADNRLTSDKPVPVSFLVGKVTKISRNAQIFEIKPTWHFASHLITLLSLIEGHFLK